MEVKIYGIEVKPEKKSDATESKREQHFVNKSVSSVQFSHLVVSDSWRSHELQHARPPCPSPTPGVHSNSYAWCW